MPRYVLDLDADSITELTPNDPDRPELALLKLAADASVIFTNVEIVPPFDVHYFFAGAISFAFDATAADVARYLAFYDADPDYAIPYDDYLRLRPRV